MVSPLVLARVVSLATSVRKRRRKKMEEFELDWIPEDTGAPYEADECFNDIPAHTIDKICKSKYGHTNWARMGQMSPTDLVGNPCEFDYTNGVIYFKNETFV